MTNPARRAANWFSQHRKRNTVLAVVLVLALGTGLWMAARTLGSSDTTATTRIVTATTGTMQQTVTGSGTVEATSTEDLNFGVAGRVTSVQVSTGDKVRKNQALARIDSASLASGVAQAEAAVASAESKLTDDQDADASSAQLRADQASLRAARADLAAARDDLDDATLRSPIAGTVSVVNLADGQFVSANSASAASSGSGTGSGSSAGGASSSGSTSESSGSTPQVQVISTGSHVVNLNVDETQIANVTKDDQATVTVSGISDPIFGTVSSVGLVATTTSGVSSFPVVVAITGSPEGLYPGSTAEVSITYRQLNDVLQVPSLAVNRNGNTQTVQLVTDSKTKQREVTTGVTSGGQTQILSGLSEGDRVEITIPAAARGAGSSGTGGSGMPGGGAFPGGGEPPTGGGFPNGGAFPGGGSVSGSGSRAGGN